MSGRHVRVGEEIKREVSVIIAKEVKDPRLGMISITDVDVSRDLSFAKVYFSMLGTEEERNKTLEGLTRARGFIRSELAKRLRLRHTPEVSFHFDGSLEQGAKMDALLKALQVDASEKDGD